MIWSSENQHQQQKTATNLKQAEVVIRMNDIYGRLYAEIERLMKYLLKALDIDMFPTGFERFLCQETDDPISMMMNIEGYLDALRGFQLICEKEKDFQLSPLPELYRSEFMQHTKLMTLIDPKNLKTYGQQTAYDVLSYMVDMLNQKNIAVPQPLPKHLSERIISDQDRDRYCQDAVRNNQMGAISMVNQVHAMDEQITQQVQTLAKDPRYQTPSFTPYIDSYNYGQHYHANQTRSTTFDQYAVSGTTAGQDRAGYQYPPHHY